MTTAPRWVSELLGEFGRSAGIESFELNARDAAALTFESGAVLRFEYAYDSLTVMITLPVSRDAETAKRVLRQAMPDRRGDFRIRCGLLPKAEKAFFAIRLPHAEITLPILNAAFSTLRRLADPFGEGVR